MPNPIPPSEIWLQWHNPPDHDEHGPVVTWCDHAVNDDDVQYIRTDWQAPETAPRDTKILATVQISVSAKPKVVIGWFNRHINTFSTEIYSYNADWITAWMPLPNPHQGTQS